MTYNQKKVCVIAFLEYICYFCGMISLHTVVCDSYDCIPEMECVDFFHGKALFRMFENTPRITPYMIVVCTSENKVVAHMLAAIRYRTSLFPPFLYTHCIVIGVGEYADGPLSREMLFDRMLSALTKTVQSKALYIEFSSITEKMYGYRCFRENGYFPIHWQNVRNSLHSRPPEERLSDKARRRLGQARAKGLCVETVKDEGGLQEFVRLLRRHNRLKPKRYIPDINFFRQVMDGDGGRLFLTRYKGKIIGCSMCVFSENNAYLWYSASLRKTYAMSHPDTFTVWSVIKYAYEHHFDHIVFMDVGLPFKKNPYRDFILQFGGKPVGTYKWFRVSVKWINRIFAWIYRD